MIIFKDYLLRDSSQLEYSSKDSTEFLLRYNNIVASPSAMPIFCIKLNLIFVIDSHDSNHSQSDFSHVTSCVILTRLVVTFGQVSNIDSFRFVLIIFSSFWVKALVISLLVNAFPGIVMFLINSHLRIELQIDFIQNETLNVGSFIAIKYASMYHTKVISTNDVISKSGQISSNPQVMMLFLR